MTFLVVSSFSNVVEIPRSILVAFSFATSIPNVVESSRSKHVRF